jgi:hypothetical protein
LTIRGTGTQQRQAGNGRAARAGQREAYFREERVGPQGFVHERLVPSPNLSIS